MAVHHVSPHEQKADRKAKRGKHPHRTVIEHLHKNGKPTGHHVVTHDYPNGDGEPAYGPKFEDKTAFESNDGMMEHLAKKFPAAAGGGGADDDEGQPA